MDLRCVSQAAVLKIAQLSINIDESSLVTGAARPIY